MGSNASVQFHFSISVQDTTLGNIEIKSFYYPANQNVDVLQSVTHKQIQKRKLQTKSLSQMDRVGNTGSTLEFKYVIASISYQLHSSQHSRCLSPNPIVIMMTGHSSFIAHQPLFIHTKNYQNQSVSKTYIMCTCILWIIYQRHNSQLGYRTGTRQHGFQEKFPKKEHSKKYCKCTECCSKQTGSQKNKCSPTF